MASIPGQQLRSHILHGVAKNKYTNKIKYNIYLKNSNINVMPLRKNQNLLFQLWAYAVMHSIPSTTEESHICK